MKFKFNIFALLISVASISLLVSCGSGDSSAWGNFKPLKELDKHIDGYYSASLGDASNPKAGKPAVYIDFSDGLIQAYTKNSTNKDMIQAITNKLVSPEIEWYAMDSGKIKKLELTSNQVFNKVSNSKEYKSLMAPIQQTLKKITESNNDALMVTDYEEYTTDGKEQLENYPKKYFIDWLKKGNSISFLYTDYTEVNAKTKITSQKHLYFTVFTQGKTNENSMISQIKDALKGRYSPKEFNLNNNAYTVSNDYGGKEMTGITNKTFAKWVNYNNNANFDKKLPYEVIGLNKPWDKKLDEYVKNIIDKEDGVLMEKLTLNASDQSSYKLNKIAVKLYDASDDYEHYARCEEAKNHMPKLEKDKGKNDVWSKESAKDAITKTCYDDKTTKLKKEWIYAPTTDPEALKSIDEVLDYDQKIFTDHLKNSPDKVELITTFHKNYKLKKVEKADGLWRIDFVIDDATFNDSNSQLADFSWQSTTMAGTPNNSLSEAIRNTLQDPSVSPKGKIIYTYYIKLGNSNKSE